MDIFTTLAYPTGDLPPEREPLARYLPPVPRGVAPDFLAQHAGAGAWVLEPFGASPRLAVEMARLGYRVLAASSNPVGRFLFEMAAASLPRAEFQGALAELASARKSDERMESHIQSLYTAQCTRCARSVPVEAFIWQRGGKVPVSRILTCAACNEQGERQATPADRKLAEQMEAASPLHRSRALERVAARDDPDREFADEALQYYPARAIYALITIINKMDSMSLTPLRRRCLAALALTAFDEANTLWPHPDERPRPRQLTVPPRYRENNVWLALERGVETWSAGGQPVPVATWPGQPPESGGICLFEGPLRSLAPALKSIPLQAVLTALPRPNQAYWALSALWAGWIWGRGAVAPFKMGLRRRRYDWNWHAAALHASLRNLSPHLPLTVPLFAIIAEPEASYLTAAVLAASSAGFDLNGLALRTPSDPVYLLWHRRAFAHTPTSSVRPDETSEAREPDHRAEVDPTPPQVVRDAIQSYLTQRGEPATYLHLHAAALAALADNRLLAWQEEALARIHAPILEALKGPDFIHHGGTGNLETGLWGLPLLEGEGDPLPDRAEKTVIAFLLKNPGCTLDELETALHAELRGLLTPPLSLTRAILDSYALPDQGKYSLRPEDDPSARRRDLEAAGEMLGKLAAGAGWTARRLEGVARAWAWEEKGETHYIFHLLASALVCRVLRENQFPAGISLLVIPGGRAGLFAFKLERDPALKQLWSGGWRVLKYRQLRRLASMPIPGRSEIEDALQGDPIVQPEQMTMF
ncbi:MAG: hypothetical protein FJZ96_08775 [Chloroflexi bacterium]|nr:hypothetical protein [Chloroflexota bacterium]